MYEPQSLFAWMTLGENKAPRVIDFQAWLNGTPLSFNQFDGRLDTDLTFATY